MKKAKAKAQVKKRQRNAAEGDFIPPLSFKNPNKSVDSDPPRGSVTEGLGIIQAFTALVQEGKVVQYRLLRAAVQVGPKINLGHDLWKGFLTEQLGIIGKGYNPLTIEQGMRDNHHGQTLNRSCRERVWEAAVPRQCTDEEITKGCRDCGSRMDADGATLVDDSNRWYKVRFHYEQGPGVQKFRVEEYGLPDLPDDELVQHFTTHPLPTWYRRGINFDIHTATGPDDERFPPTTIKAVFRNTQDPGMEARYACWAEEFIAEVQVCVERFRGSDELPHELARLIAELQAFNIGDGEAKNCITALRSTTAGANALNIVQAGKDRLLLRLEKVATTATTKPKPAKKSSAFTVPVLARFCWCMEKAGHSDHGIVNATAASRLANHYGLLHKRTGEKLKQERDRFDGADGKPYLKGGPRSNEAYGRRTWAAVKVELERIGYSDAVRLAEAILSDL